MKSKRQIYCEYRINQLRNELHRLIEHEQLNNCNVQKMSQELDAMIIMYYRQLKRLAPECTNALSTACTDSARPYMTRKAVSAKKEG